MSVEPDLGAPPLAPAEDETREQLALNRVQQRVVPQQDPDLELPLAAQQEFEQLAELARRAVAAVALADQAGLAIELPAQDEDRAFGLEQRGAQRAEIVGRIDERGRAWRVAHTPAGAASGGAESCGAPSPRGLLAAHSGEW